MFALVLVPLRATALLLLGVLVALGMGLWQGVLLLARSSFDGHVSTQERQDVESATWGPAWAALRTLPFLKVD